MNEANKEAEMLTRYESIVNKLTDVLITEKCTVVESYRLLSGVRQSIESSPVQKSQE